jgi:hypothetical protein
MAPQSVIQSREQVDSLLAQCRKITAETTEHDDPLLAAKAAKDFLLDG